MKPKIIEGSIFSDNRGSVSFVNDFKFDTIIRFYTITNSAEHPFRAWQGHKLDSKNFYCVQGSFKIFYIEIDNWESPSKQLKINSMILSENDSKVLIIPAGFANGILALEPNSKLLSFSTLPINDLRDDDVRFNKDYWRI